jgi:DNA-binding NarL/FixJ family response regulator
MAIRAVIADDHLVVRLGLKSLLTDAGITVIGEADSGDKALQLAYELSPDIVIMDVRMPNGDGLTALSRLKLEKPDLPVLMLSTYDNPTYVARSVALGASGFLLKSCSAETLIDCIRRILAGENIWSRDELRRVTGALATPRLLTDVEVPLTQRENEVLRQLALGLTNKEIAQSLDISYETVKEHVQHILRKVGVSDRTQAAVWAVRRGLV